MAWSVRLLRQQKTYAYIASPAKSGVTESQRRPISDKACQTVRRGKSKQMKICFIKSHSMIHTEVLSAENDSAIKHF